MRRESLLNRMPSRLMNLDKEPSAASSLGVPIEKRLSSISQRRSESWSANSTSWVDSNMDLCCSCAESLLNRMPSRLMNLDKEPSAASSLGVPIEKRLSSISQRRSESWSANYTSWVDSNMYLCCSCARRRSICRVSILLVEKRLSSISQRRSESWSANYTSWVDSNMYLCCSCARRRSICRVSILLGKSRKAVGSSRMMMRVCCAKALAIITF